MIGLRAEKLADDKRLHAAVWPEVAKAVHDANVRNYSIYLRRLPDGDYYLFSYLEYVGTDHKADMDQLVSATTQSEGYPRRSLKWVSTAGFCNRWFITS